MVSRAELQRQIEVAEIANARLVEDLERVERDNAAHRARESARMRSKHAEQQRERQQAEREDRRKRRQELSDGMLRLKDASEWAIVNDERGQVLELTVPLSADVEPIVHGVLTKSEGIQGHSVTYSIADEAQIQRMTDAINRTREAVRRARDAYCF